VLPTTALARSRRRAGARSPAAIRPPLTSLAGTIVLIDSTGTRRPMGVPCGNGHQAGFADYRDNVGFSARAPVRRGSHGLKATPVGPGSWCSSTGRAWDLQPFDP
jgi:hypothetical protein